MALDEKTGMPKPGTLERMMIDAGIPVAIDGQGNLMVNETKAVIEAGFTPSSERSEWPQVWVGKTAYGCCFDQYYTAPSPVLFGPASSFDCTDWRMHHCDPSNCGC
jgi:hypothetical protein